MNAFATLNHRPFSLASVVIETERLRLVPIEEAHAPDIFREFTEDVTRYMFPKPAENLEETLSFIRDSQRRMADGANLQLVILLKATGDFLGCCGLHGEGKVRTPELGIWLKKSAHGNGYGLEAIRGLVEWAREHLILDALTYPVDHRNAPSRKIPESLGARVVGEQQDTGQAGNRLELLVYRLEAAKTP